VTNPLSVEETTELHLLNVIKVFDLCVYI